MTAWYLGVAAILLLSIAGSLWQIARGPSAADRMIGAQLVGTGGIATVLLVAAAADEWAMLDVALVLALLAAFASVAFVKAVSPDGLGDPEEDDDR